MKAWASRSRAESAPWRIVHRRAARALVTTRTAEGPREASTMGTEAASEYNFAQVFRARSATYARSTRWRQKVGEKWSSATFRENAAMVNSVMSGLDALGARSGDAIGIMSGTRWEW